MFVIHGSSSPAFFKVHDLGGELHGVSCCRHDDDARNDSLLISIMLQSIFLSHCDLVSHHAITNTFLLIPVA